MKIINALAKHAYDLAPRLRQSDVGELRILYGLEPYEAILENLNTKGRHYTVTLNDKVMAIFGVGLDDNAGVPYLIGSPELQMHKLKLVSISSVYLTNWLKEFGVLRQWKLIDDVKNIRWLEAIGFEKIEKFDAYGQTFITLELR